MTPKAEVIVKQNKNYFKSIKCVGGGGGRQKYVKKS